MRKSGREEYAVEIARSPLAAVLLLAVMASKGPAWGVGCRGRGRGPPPPEDWITAWQSAVGRGPIAGARDYYASMGMERIA